MYPWYTYMAGQHPQLDPYLMPQVQAQPVPSALPPPPQPVVAPPCTAGSQNASCNDTSRAALCVHIYANTSNCSKCSYEFTQTMQTPVKMEIGNSPSVTPPVAMTSQTPQSTPKTPRSDSKGNSDSNKNDSEKSKSKKKPESIKESKELDLSRDKAVVSDKEQENPSEPEEHLYLKLSKEHLSLPKVHRLLGYGEGKQEENQADNVQDQAAVSVAQVQQVQQVQQPQPPPQ